MSLYQAIISKASQIMPNKELHDAIPIIKEFAQAIAENKEPLIEKIDNGCYKKVFDLSSNYIIKSISFENDSIAEWSLYKLARKDNKISKYFVDTAYIFLKQTCNFMHQRVDAIQIQKKVSIPSFSPENNLKKYLPNLQKKIIQIDLTCGNWINQIISLYGEEDFNYLLDFLIQNGVFDLHRRNLGFSLDKEKRPLIIDWLS